MPFDYLFFVNFVSTFLILISCLKIAFRWKRRKMLITEFTIVGIAYFLFFICFTSWFYIQNLYSLIFAGILSLFWSSFLSAATLRILYSPKLPLNWILSIYLAIPFIYIFTGSAEMTSFQTIALSAIVFLYSSSMLTIRGKSPMRIYSIFGIAASLIILLNMFTFISGEIVVIPWFIVNSLVALAFVGFWRTSYKKPDGFIADYDHEKDGL